MRNCFALCVLLLVGSSNIDPAVCEASSSSPTLPDTTSTKSLLGKLGGGSLQPPRRLSPNRKTELSVEDDVDQGDGDHEQDHDDVSLLCNRATFIAETDLPTDLGMFRLRAYRTAQQAQNQHVGREPCVIYAKDKPPFANAGSNSFAKGVPVRVHDQCFTSEVFRSQRCDCKEQLKMALAYVQEHGGAIIYLQQEGRGIGLANKVAAYALQDEGLDTVDANLHLGLPEDCRQYGVVPSILEDMQIQSIRLITNNPRKVDRLKALGVHVQDTIPMVVSEANPFNRRYLETKQQRMAHLNFGEMLAKSSPAAAPAPIVSASTSLLQTRQSTEIDVADASTTRTATSSSSSDTSARRRED